MLKNYRRLAAIAVVLALSATTAGCAATSEPAAAPVETSDPDNPVFFTYPSNPSFDLIYLADKLGYFDHAGIKPKYVGAVDANQIIPQIGAGKLDVGTRMASLSISAIAAGQPIKIIAAANRTIPEAPHMEYFVKKGSKITTDDLSALEGKTIGLNGFGACAEFVTKQFLASKGVDVDKINWVPTPDTQLEQAVDTGQVDLAIIHAPFNGHADNNPGLTRLFSDWDEDQGASGSAPYSVNTDFLKAHPAQVTELVGIIGKTENWVNAHPDEAREYIAERVGFDVDDVSRYAYVNNAIIDEKQIQYWISTLEKFDQISKGQLTPDDVATNAYNPYATSAKLIATQSDNTKVLTDTED